MPAEYPDLLATLNEVRRRVPDDRHVWCTAGLSFETVTSTRRALLLGGVWCPQLLRDEANPWLVTLEKPRVVAAEAATGPWAEWVPLMEAVAQDRHSLLLVTGTIGDELLTVLIVNASRDALRACVVRPGPGAATAPTAPSKPPQRAGAFPLAARAWCRRDVTAVFFDGEAGAGTALSTVEVIDVGGEHAADQYDRLVFLSRELVRGR